MRRSALSLSQQLCFLVTRTPASCATWEARSFYFFWPNWMLRLFRASLARYPRFLRWHSYRSTVKHSSRACLHLNHHFILRAMADSSDWRSRSSGNAQAPAGKLWSRGRSAGHSSGGKTRRGGKKRYGYIEQGLTSVIGPKAFRRHFRFFLILFTLWMPLSYSMPILLIKPNRSG